MNLFVDTNIVVDYLDERPGFFESARKLMILAYCRECTLWMSSSQITDVFHLLTNGARSSEVDDVKRSIQQSRRMIRICSLTEADIDAALDSIWSDFEDACVFQCALRLKVDAIIARNQKGFEKSSLRVLDCDELFLCLREEKGLAYEEIPWWRRRRSD